MLEIELPLETLLPYLMESSFSTETLSPVLTEEEKFIQNTLFAALSSEHANIASHVLCLEITARLSSIFPQPISQDHPIYQRLKVIVGQAIVNKFSSRLMRLPPMKE